MLSSAKLELHTQNRRARYRHKLRTLAHIKLNSDTSGILRDVSDVGLALQVLSQIPPNEVIHIHLELPNPRLRFEADGRVAWSDPLGQAGIVFVNIASRSHRLLKEWLFTQILSDAYRVAGDHASELLFSSSSRPAIRLEPDLCSATLESQSVGLFWFKVSASRFSRLIDGTVLVCAVLLFSLLTLFLTDVLPAWPLAAAFVLGTAVVFTAIYWAIFALWFGVTPGSRLATLASIESRDSLGERELTRFR